jgi:hypothetical protein
MHCRADDVGLRHILLHHGTTRKEVYRRLFGILWYGNKIGRTVEDQTKPPTYVFPPELLASVRQRFPDSNAGAGDEEYAAAQGVYRVTWSDIAGAKWSSPPKSCEHCSKAAKKPY